MCHATATDPDKHNCDTYKNKKFNWHMSVGENIPLVQQLAVEPAMQWPTDKEEFK